MAKPRQISPGKWRVQIRRHGVTVLDEVFGTEREAKQATRDAERDLARTKKYATRHGGPKTVADAIDRYDVDHPNTERHQGERRNWWRVEIGDRRLAAITPRILSDCAAKLRETGRADSTVNRYMAAISVVFEHCRDPGVDWLEDNPARRVKRRRESKGRTRWLRDGEIAQLLEVCDASTWPGLPILVRLALAAGARAGELLGLTWRNVDTSRGTLYFEETKNGEPRLVPIAGEALERLQEWQRTRRRPDTDLVVPGRRNPQKPIDPRKPWLAACAAAGLGDDVVFHTLRHTSGAILAQSGLNTRQIMATMGHKTHEMATRYQHVADEHHDAVRRAMVERLG